MSCYDLVLASQRAGLAAVAAGLPARELDATCRAVFEEAGYGDWFLHGTGHGVGLDIHEDPFAARVSDRRVGRRGRGDRRTRPLS